MKFCFLSETAAWGGGEMHTAVLAQTLADRGHQVTIAALGHNAFDAIARKPGTRFEVRNVPLAQPVRQMSWRACTKLLRTFPGDVGVLVRWGLEVGSLTLDLAARMHFRRYLAIEHSAATLPARESRSWWHGRLRGLGLWRYRQRVLWSLRSLVPDLVVCVSDVARRHLMRDFRVPGRKVVTIHNGVDCARFHPDPAARQAVRHQWGVGEDALVFGSVSRLHVDKVLDLAIVALAEITARLPGKNARLVLVGDGPERQRLEALAKQAGIADRVILAGFTSRPWEACAGMDFFVLPSRDEALPLALLEAMACGCSPIAMAVGGVPEVVSNANLGWLIPAGHRVRFTEAMAAALLLSDEERAQRGRWVRQHVLERFDVGRQNAVLAGVLER